MIRRQTAYRPGRHRNGQAHSEVHRRLWDGPLRAEAERLDQTWQSWSVLYGVHSRLFYAIATWPTPTGLIVSAQTSYGLEARMYEAEMDMIAPSETHTPTPAVFASL